MLVDQFGAPLSIDDLTEQQTDDAKLSHLHNHFAQHPSKGLTPRKLAKILQLAEQGDIIAQCELAEDMEEKDGHIFSELQKRRLCIQSVPWQIKPPRNATDSELRDTDMLQEQFEDMEFLPDLIFDMTDAISKGFSNNEITWRFEEKLWLPQSVEFRDPSWFMVAKDNRNELRLRDNSQDGERLNPFGWITHIHKTKSGYLSRNGLARVLAWPYIFKTFSISDFAEFNEIYGLPLRLGKYPTGATKTEKNTLLRAVMQIGHNAGGIIPKGMEIDFKEAAKGNHAPFDSMIQHMERTQSKAILGGTLTSQADGKSSTNALGNVHNEVRQELRDSDVKQIAATLTKQLLLPMYQLNGKSFTSPNRTPRVEFDTTEPESIKLFSDSMPKLVGQGMRIPVKWAHDKLQIPIADENEEVLGAVKSSSEPAPTPQESETPEQLTRKNIKKMAALKASFDADPSSEFSKQLAKQMAPVIEQFNQDIDSLINDVDSFDDLQDKLERFELDIEQATELLQLGLVASELAGAQDVIEEEE
ncbi:Mu-like prophage FluMu protein gp29 [Thalassotalea loyana]|uniref:Mu-like prophage FluMu protein gp29 n=1 Tax=Thalassotalea loyana TaxID=280483 RepID=A0ABQ6HE35_9GAMM|nr:DUF935 domain-containing protein [Thalassotalea loyana]GLX86363.1 Mu-like prophage FluMu protein gp29 [Thalassotalea loyana]